MTPYQHYTQDEMLRVKVAELCGWKWFPKKDGDEEERHDPLYAWHPEKKSNVMAVMRPRSGTLYCQLIPKYESSLDAMDDAILWAHRNDPHWAEKYLPALATVMGVEDGDPSGVGRFDLLIVSAKKRAEAFVLAMAGEKV